mgnify:CR=1 FL=1
MSILTLQFLAVLATLATVSLYLVKNRKAKAHKRVEKKIRQMLETSGKPVFFHDISKELGCRHSEIVEITKRIIARDRVSGVISFDETCFISEKELRSRTIHENISLNELVSEISKIDNPEIEDIDLRIAADDCQVRSLKTSVIHEAVVKGQKIGVISESIHVGQNLLSKARLHDEDIRALLHPYPSPIRNVDLFNVIKMKVWKYAFPLERVLNAFQSEKPVLLFLDENDSDFNSYLLEVLKTNQDFLTYYADYIHLKKRQKTFAQTLLSLLFLESKNVQTGKTFAGDVVRVVTQAFHSVDYHTVNQFMRMKIASLLRVFRAFLSGTGTERAASISFLKCMKCDVSYGHLKSFGFFQDLSDQENTAKFFSNILACFISMEKLNGRKFVVCIGNIPIHEPGDLIDSGLPELFDQISPKLKRIVKFYLVSKGSILGDRVDLNFMSPRSENHDFLIEYKDDLKIVRIPFVSKVTNIEDLASSIVKDLTAFRTHIGLVISDLVSEDSLKKLSSVLIEHCNRQVSVLDISHALSALLGVAIEKYPTPLTSADINALFAVPQPPASAFVRTHPRRANIRDLKDGTRDKTVEGRITQIGKEKEVWTRYGKTRLVYAMLEDSTGKIQLNLWGDDIDRVKEGDIVRIYNGYVITYENTISFNIPKYKGSIIVNPSKTTHSHFSSSDADKSVATYRRKNPDVKLASCSCWCYATKRQVHVKGELRSKHQTGLFKITDCEHEECPKRLAVDCLIGKTRKGH